jgi:hypothetical protein
MSTNKFINLPMFLVTKSSQIVENTTFWGSYPQGLLTVVKIGKYGYFFNFFTEK